MLVFVPSKPSGQWHLRREDSVGLVSVLLSVTNGSDIFRVLRP